MHDVENEPEDGNEDEDLEKEMGDEDDGAMTTKEEGPDES